MGPSVPVSFPCRLWDCGRGLLFGGVVFSPSWCHVWLPSFSGMCFYWMVRLAVELFRSVAPRSGVGSSLLPDSAMLLASIWLWGTLLGDLMSLSRVLLEFCRRFCLTLSASLLVFCSLATPRSLLHRGDVVVLGRGVASTCLPQGTSRGFPFSLAPFSG